MKKEIEIDWWRFFALSSFLWLIQAGYTSLNTGLYQQFSQGSASWLAIIIYSFGTALSWMFFVPIIFWFILKLQNRNASLIQVVLIHLLVGLFISFTQRYLNILISYNLIVWTEAIDLNLVKWSNFMGLNYLSQVGNSLIVYFVTMGILYGYLYYIKSQNYILERAQLQTNLSKARLEALKYQFQPHFLFNSLQSVSTLMHRDITVADESLGDLSELLRHSIKTIDVEKISLGEEFFYLQKYIDLQKMRYEEKLSSDIQMPEQLINCKVPPLILQPLVENSIKHNIEQSNESIHISIDVTSNEDKILISCLDNGKSRSHNIVEQSTKRGLENLKRRLDAIYEDSDLTFGELKDVGFKTMITIPLEY